MGYRDTSRLSCTKTKQIRDKQKGFNASYIGQGDYELWIFRDGKSAQIPYSVEVKYLCKKTTWVKVKSTDPNIYSSKSKKYRLWNVFKSTFKSKKDFYCTINWLQSY